MVTLHYIGLLSETNLLYPVKKNYIIKVEEVKYNDHL